MIKLSETIMILDLHRQGLPVSAITRQTGIDCKTAQLGLEAPSYGPRKLRAAVIGPFAGHLGDRVETYASLTGSRLFREIKERVDAGGYTAVTDFLRDVRPTAIQGFEVRFETSPGDQAQVDFAQVARLRLRSYGGSSSRTRRKLTLRHNACHRYPTASCGRRGILVGYFEAMPVDTEAS